MKADFAAFWKRRIKGKTKYVFAGLLFAVLLVVMAQGVVAQDMADEPYETTTIDRCGEINESGEYNLTTDLTNGTEMVCIVISASDVTLNLDGNNVTRNSSVAGILASNGDNVTINGNDGYVKDFNSSGDFGIIFQNMTNSSVNDVSVHNNSAGITANEASQHIGIYGNTIANNTVGVNVGTLSTLTLSQSELLDQNDFSNNDNDTDIKDKYTLTFNVTDESDAALENARIEVTDNESYGEVIGVTNSSGIVNFTVGNTTTVDYSITKDRFTPLRDSVSISGANETVNVTLKEAPYRISFEIKNESDEAFSDVDIWMHKVFDNDSDTKYGDVKTDANGEAEFWVANGTYKYHTNKENFVKRSAKLRVSGANKSEELVVPEAQYTVTFNVTNESGDPIPSTRTPHVGLYGESYNVLYEPVNDTTGLADYGLAENITYTYIAAADNKIRTGGQFEGTGENETINITLREPDRTQFAGYTLAPNGSALEDVNVTVKGYNQTMWEADADPAYLNASKSETTGHFNVTDMATTIGGNDIVTYIIDMRKYNTTNPEQLDYRSQSYLNNVDKFTFGILGIQNYSLSRAVTFNVNATGIPEFYRDDSAKIIRNESFANYSHSLEWLNDSEQWAYITDENNLTILESDFTVNRTLDLPVKNANGLYYNGTHFYTLNTSDTNSESDSWVWALNASGADGITIDEKILLKDSSVSGNSIYETVSAIEYHNESYYVLGNRGPGAVDRYNDSFYHAESVLSDIRSDGDIHFHEDRWYRTEESDQIQLKIYNESWGVGTQGTGDFLHGFMLDCNVTGLANNGTHWYMGSNETGNLTEMQLMDGGVKKFDISVNDKQSGTVLTDSYDPPTYPGVYNFSFTGLADREFLLRVEKKGTPLQINREISDVTAHPGWNEQTRELNLTFNLTQEFRRVSGHVKQPNGSDNFTNLSVAYQEIDPDNLASHTAGFNRTAANGEGDEYDPENGTYDMGIIHPIDDTARYLLQVYAYNETADQHYGAIKSLTLESGGGDVSDHNVTLEPLLGNETGLEVFGPEGSRTQNITTNLKQFQFVNESNHLVQPEYDAEVFMDYTEHFENSTEVQWRRQSNVHTTNSDPSGFEIPVFGSDGMSINVFARTDDTEYVPTTFALTEDRLTKPGPVNITLREWDEGDMMLDEAVTPDIETRLYRGETADYPAPTKTDTVSESYVGQEPLAARLQNQQALIKMLGGNLSFRMTDINNDISVHYSNIETGKSGAPDAFFNSQAELREAGDSFTSLWKFGSSGPQIYDDVLVSMPYNESAGDTHTVEIPYLYDEDMNVIWNASVNDTEDIPEHYSEYLEGEYRAYVNGTGVECTEDNENLTDGIGYKDTEEGRLWLKIPHFSAVGLEVDAASETTDGDTGSGGSTTSPTDDDDADDEDETEDEEEPVEEGPETGPESITEEAIVDEETGEARAEIEAEAGQQIEVTIPAPAEGAERESNVESVTAISTTAQQITVSVRQMDSTEVEVPARETQIAFEEITVDGEVENATVTFSVSTARLSELDADPDDIVKERYDPETGEWQELPTSHIGDFENLHRCEADVPEFSLFATAIESDEEEPVTTEEPITEEEPATEEEPTPGPTLEQEETVTEQPVETTETGTPGFTIGLALIALIGGALVVLWMRKTS